MPKQKELIDSITARDLYLIKRTNDLYETFAKQLDSNLDAIPKLYESMYEEHRMYLSNIAKEEVFKSQDSYNTIMGLTAVTVLALSLQDSVEMVDKIKLGELNLKDSWDKQATEAADIITTPSIKETLLKQAKRKLSLLLHAASHTINNHARLFAYKVHPNIVGMQQVSILDSATSNICNKYAYKKWYLDGQPYKHTLPYNGGPPRHINCRSTIIPLNNLEEKRNMQESIMTKIRKEYYSFDVKSFDETGFIEGYGSFFGNADSYNDVVAKGAFKKTISERAPVMLWQHDPAQPIGVWKELKEDNNGLYVKGKIDLNTVKGQEAYSLLKSGAIKGLSIGFIPTKWETARSGVRTINEVKLFEISIVTFPANELATVTEVKNEMINKFNNLDYIQQAKVLAYIEGLKALNYEEPGNYNETVNPCSHDDNIIDCNIKESTHSHDKAATNDIEPELYHSIEKLIKSLKGEKI